VSGTCGALSTLTCGSGVVEMTFRAKLLGASTLVLKHPAARDEACRSLSLTTQSFRVAAQHHPARAAQACGHASTAAGGLKRRIDVRVRRRHSLQRPAGSHVIGHRRGAVPVEMDIEVRMMPRHQPSALDLRPDRSIRGPVVVWTRGGARFTDSDRLRSNDRVDRKRCRQRPKVDERAIRNEHPPRVAQSMNHALVRQSSQRPAEDDHLEGAIGERQRECGSLRADEFPRQAP